MSTKRPVKPVKGQKKSNPFDEKVSKPKFDVLNRDRRGIYGAPAQSKAKNIAIRQATLLPEVQRRGKATSFVDRRFGERDKNLTEEEKMLERFSRERQKANKAVAGKLGKKRSIFNLDMDEEYGEDSLASLTHLGQDVEELDEFSDPEEGAFAHEKGLIDPSRVKRGHFGGYSDNEEEEPAEPKTKAEVMKEVIAKSKFYKAERQKVREENAELCEALDDSFSALRPSLLKMDRSREVRQEDDYDAAIKQMLFDARAKPTDRTLTEEESRKKREAAVEAREARMAGRREDDDDDDGHDDEVDSSSTSKKSTERTDTDKDEERAKALLEQFCGHDGSTESLTPIYKRIVEMSNGPACVALGRAIRTELGTLLTRFTAAQRRPFYPPRSALLLFHLIGRLYSTSDMHHVIVTPAQLLMTAWLEHGRMTRPKHLLAALFMAQTLLAYQLDSKRVLPEVFNMVSLVLGYFLNERPIEDFCFDGPFNRVVATRLKASFTSDNILSRALDFSDLSCVDEKEFSPELASGLFAALMNIAEQLRDLYSDLPCYKVLMAPILARSSGSSYEAFFTALARSEEMHAPLALQHHKPIPLPMLTPDLEPEGGKDRDTRDTDRLRHALKREKKGAKRELRRDNEFLARHEATERKRKDQDYKQMINRVYGTIANDSAGISGGAGKNKRQRTK